MVFLVDVGGDAQGRLVHVAAEAGADESRNTARTGARSTLTVQAKFEAIAVCGVTSSVRARRRRQGWVEEVHAACG
jgi:hypothetical protein